MKFGSSGRASAVIYGPGHRVLDSYRDHAVRVTGGGIKACGLTGFGASQKVRTLKVDAPPSCRTELQCMYLTYALSLPVQVQHRPQTILLHPVLSRAATSVFLQPYLNRSVIVSDPDLFSRCPWWTPYSSTASWCPLQSL